MHKALSSVAIMGLASLSLTTACFGQRTEKYRPQYHFAPNNGWIGDPDSLVHFNGYYHLFWPGHAISQDLVHWTELPYPIIGDPGVYQVNTGGAVIDKNNVSQLGTNSFINFHSLAATGDQRVGISSSTDIANNYTDFGLYSGNPVLSPNPAPASDFRDPDVFWDSQSNSWVMLVTLGPSNKIQFYRSTDLTHWGSPFFTFGPDGDTSNMWETPSLFQLPVDGNSNNMKWVLMMGEFPNHVIYFIGNFDGSQFTNLYPGQSFPVDQGLDFYAARTWRDYDGNQNSVPLIGWMGNWQYSTNAPSQLTYSGEGAISIPRNLSLKTYPDGIRLVQTPLPALTQQLRNTSASAQNVVFTGTHPITDFAAFHPSVNSYEIDATFNVSSGANSATSLGFNLLVDSGHTHKLVIEYNPSTQNVTVDRTTASDDSTLNTSSQTRNYFPVVAPSVNALPSNGLVELHMFIDKSSIEIFAGDGRNVMTYLTYPGESQLGIEVFANGGSATLANFSAWNISSIWNGSPTSAIVSGGIYEIRKRPEVNESGSKVIDASSYNNLTQLQQYDWWGGDNQKWKVELVEPGYWQSFGKWIPAYYKITSVGSLNGGGNGKVIDLRDANNSNGAVIQLYDWLGYDNQKWQIEGVGGGYFRIMSKASSTDYGFQVIEVDSKQPDGGLVNQDPLQLWKYFGYHHQDWQFIQIQ